LLWLIAIMIWAAYKRWIITWPSPWRKAIPGLIAATIVAACIGISWHVADAYSTPIKKTRRIATLFPDTPRVWERLGWTLYGVGQYEEAIDCAEKELRHDAPNVKSGAYQLLGMSELRRGNGEAALELLHKSLEINPGNSLGLHRLATAYDSLGRTDEAVTYFEEAVAAAPLHNPRIVGLAMVYRRLGRPADAREMYNKALANNPYDVAATMGLAELDIQEATRESYLSAERLLESLLDWMPENTDALTNLGVVRKALGRTAEAMKAYNEALERDPDHVTAMLNLAQIYLTSGDIGQARPLFERAADIGPVSISQTEDLHWFFLEHGAFERCASAWEHFAERIPGSPDAATFATFSKVLAQYPDVLTEDDGSIVELHDFPPAVATLVYLDLAGGRYADATARADTLCGMGLRAADARRQLLSALDRFDRRQPNVPWTFCIAARLLIADRNLDGAGVFIQLCEERCDGPECLEQVQFLRSKLDDAKSSSHDTSASP
jgi:tetratricopeptide (TPR) repeat protein